MSVVKSISKRISMLKGESPYLEHVYLDTTGSCTNRCYMCPGRAAKKHNKPMSDDTFNLILDRLSKYGFENNLHFYGQNEPFTDPKIFERVKLARKKLPKATLHMISNFTVMNGHKMDKLTDLPLDRLVNSIYALDEKSYRQITQKPNFNKAIQNQITFVKKWAKKKKYPFNVFLLDTEFNRHDQNFIEYFLNILPVSKTVYTTLYSSRRVLPRKLNKSNFGLCLFQNMLIIGDGTVSICNHDHDCDLSPGNIKDMNIYELMNGPHAKSLRHDMLFRGGGNGDFCSVCDWANENKFLFFIIPHDTFRKQLLTMFHLDNGISKKVFRTIADNSSKEIDKKMEFFLRFFPDGSDVPEGIDSLRIKFKDSQDRI